MATPLDTPVHLKERESLRPQNGTGLEVRCLLGNLWITEEGEREDRILSRGSRSCSTGQVCRSSPRSAVPACSSCSREPSLRQIRCGMRHERRGAGSARFCPRAAFAGRRMLDLASDHPGQFRGPAGLRARALAKSRYNRFFGALQELPPAELERVTHLDRRYDLTLVAETDAGAASIVIGEARHAFTPDRLECEFALSVADAWRGRGIGTLLMAEMERRARSLGAWRLTAEVLRANEPMKALALKTGFGMDDVPSDARLVRIVKDLAPSRTDRPGRAADAPGLPLAA